MTWKTIVTYVDLQTGEVISKKRITSGEMVKNKIVSQKTTFNGQNTGTKWITYGCERNTQTKLF